MVQSHQGVKLMATALQLGKLVVARYQAEVLRPALVAGSVQRAAPAPG